MDSACLPSKGSATIDAALIPQDEQTIRTYQYDEFHNTDNIYGKANSWKNFIFIQGELEILQQRTNELILALTIITVYESVIGIKASLIFLMGVLAKIFILLGESLIQLQKI